MIYLLTLLLQAVGYGVLALVICQVLYIVVMGLKTARDAGRLAPMAIKIGTVFMYASLVWDVLCNIFVVPFIFLELPREATISQRLQRHVDHSEGWRKSLATWFAVHLLNPFSTDGPHIKLPN